MTFACPNAANFRVICPDAYSLASGDIYSEPIARQSFAHPSSTCFVPAVAVCTLDIVKVTEMPASGAVRPIGGAID